MARVELRHVYKSFGPKEVLKDFTLDVADGEFVSVVGPSGGGKTTLLRIIAGIEFPERGEILIGGKVVNALPPKDRQVAMVFQDYAIYPHMNVFDNIAYGLRAHGAPRRQVEEKVAHAAATMGISDLLRRLPGELSGGELQRVALCRVIIRDADVFLFDEPLSNLDPKLRAQARTDIIKLQKSLGTTTIYVCHDQVEALTMGNRVVLVHNGGIVQVGSPQDLYYNPVDTYVATFIGSPGMNLLEAELAKNGSGVTARVGSSIISLTGEAARKASEFVGSGGVRKALFGIRPEDMRFGQSEIKATESNQIRGKLMLIEALGTERALHFLLVGTVEKQDFTVVTPSRAAHEDLNSEFPVVCDLRQVRFFDSATGKAL